MIEGGLVSWQDMSEERFGVVTDLTGHQVTVQFDDFDDVRIFKRSLQIVRRVELTGSVRRVSTGEVGVVQGLSNAEPPRWNVAFASQVTVVQEKDLRPHILLDPANRLRSGMLGSPWQFWLALTAHAYRTEALNRDLIALGESRIDLKPHQVSVVHRVISAYPHRFLLCDEVGLGKTIEAGVILKELRARKSADRVLIVVPPNLMRQWQYELKTKFNETFSIINSETAKYLRNQHGADTNPFEHINSAIVSSSWITTGDWSRLATTVDWDLVIVDEAHHARVRYSGNRVERTRLYRVVDQLVSPQAFSKRSTLFLTATPMQLDPGEIYGLIELLDPALFPTLGHFTNHRDRVPGLNALVQDLKINGYADRSDHEEILAKVSGWLGKEATEIEAELRAGPAGIAAVCDELADEHLLTQILIRNRKKVVGGFMPRQAHRWEVALTEEERTALNAVEDYVRNGYQLATTQKNSAIGFVMVIFQKLMASSTRALRMSLDKRRSKLEQDSTTATAAMALARPLPDLAERFDEEGDDDAVLSQLLTIVGDLNQREAAELRHLVRLLDELPTDSKAETLIAGLRDLERQEENPKVLLFTEFRQTQEYLKARLEEELGWEVHLFHGQLKPAAKDEEVEAFRTSDRPTILLSTEAGGEGRNFQFCHLLVNYDLPWNPMRVEQRIGRVDRLGQTNVVQVFNFWIRGTIEERVLDVLENRIGIFEQTVGGLDPILGDTETDLKRIFQLGDAERDAELAKYEADVEKRLAEAREAEEKLRDFIMETKSFSKEVVKELEEGSQRIPAADMERFGVSLLADVNTWLREEPDGTYKVAFHEPFISDYPQHTNGAGTKRTITFRPDVAPDSEHVEYMAFGHPVIDDLVDRVTQQKYDGSATGVVVPAAAHLEPASGWLVVHQITVPGLKTIRELHTSFVDDVTGPDEDRANLLIEWSTRLEKDAAIAPEEIEAAVFDTLDAALTKAGEAAWTVLDALETDAAKDAQTRLMREVDKINAFFDYRDQAAADKLDQSRKTLDRLATSPDPDDRRILPVWQSNVHRNKGLVERLGQERMERLAELHRQSQGAGDVTLLGVARVEIRSNEETPVEPPPDQGVRGHDE
jgi:ATP-dependent helicase HepA